MDHNNIVGEIAFIDKAGTKFHDVLFWKMDGLCNFSEFKGDYETVMISRAYISTNSPYG